MGRTEQQIDWNSLRLGESEQVLKLSTHVEIRDAALALVQQAKQSVHIFSHDLEGLIYSNGAFVKALIQVAHQHRSSAVQILLRDATPAVKEGHQLVEACQRFSSDLKVRRMTEDYDNNREVFLIADRVGILLRDDYDRYQGIVNFKALRQAGKLLRFFDEAWERSQPISEFRRLYI